MKHYKAGEQKLAGIRCIPLTRKTLDGHLCLSFRDLFHNLIVQDLKGDQNMSATSSYDFIQKVQETTKNASAGKHPMSRKHRIRIQKQAKKLGMVS